MTKFLPYVEIDYCAQTSECPGEGFTNCATVRLYATQRTCLTKQYKGPRANQRAVRAARRIALALTAELRHCIPDWKP